MAMALFQVLKKRPQGARSLGGDIYVSKQKASGGTYQLALRISAAVMDRLRWRRGDSVIPEFDMEGDMGVWTLTPSDLEQAVVIHAKGPGTSGQIKATISPENMALVFPNGKAGYVGQFAEVKGGAAKFIVDYGE
jgi:hypothetical protein